MYKILIVDDEPLSVIGIRSMIESIDLDLQVTGTAGNGEEALAVMKKDMLEARVRSAETCCKQEQEVLSNMLVAIGDETTAKLLLDRYYYELKWEEAAARNGLKVSAAKMRVKRYHDMEGRVA